MVVSAGLMRVLAGGLAAPAKQPPAEGGPSELKMGWTAAAAPAERSTPLECGDSPSALKMASIAVGLPAAGLWRCFSDNVQQWALRLVRLRALR
mmetsp:Transcript_73719/g.227638  ORF Transcript_73719/g.227638 Transcript_73719/m.227638 type:complete len:94 (-) Transcript_73719:90-371(-)